MKNALLMGALPIYAKLLADSCGVEVQFGAHQPNTNGRVIYLPTLPADSELAADLAFGWIMHEEGHISESSFGNIMAGYPGHVAGILEDVRMEKVQQRKYRGGKDRLNTMVKRIVETGYFSPVSDSCTPSEAMSAFLLTRLRADVLGQRDCDDLAVRAEAKCLELFPTGAMVKLKVMMYEVEKCRDSDDSNALALAIIKMLKKEAEKPPEDGDAGGEPDDGDAGGDPDDGDAGGEPDDGDAGGDPDDGSHGKGHGDGKTENLKKVLAGEDKMGVSDLGDIVAKAIQDQVKPYDMTSVLLPESGVAPVSASRTGTDLLDTVRDGSKALKRKLYNLLEAEAESHTTYSRHGRLSPKRVARIMVGNDRVFERTDTGMTLDTAVLVMLDRSGSMCGSIDVAAQATLSLTAALDGLSGVECATAAFPHYIQGRGANDVLLLKGFDESIRTASKRFNDIGTCGCTPMSEALMWCGWQLMRRTEARKILFVVTDGDPDNWTSANYVKAQLEQMGIETMGIGIAVDVSALFPTSRAISNVQELNKSVFEMMSAQLFREAA